MHVTSTAISWRRVLAAMLTSFLILTLYLCLSRWPATWFTAWSDYAAIAISIAWYIQTILRTPLTKKDKLLLVGGVAPLLAAVLAIYALIFICAVSGDCL